MSLGQIQADRMARQLKNELRSWRDRVVAPTTQTHGWAWSFHRSQVEATADVIDGMLAQAAGDRAADVVTGAKFLWDWFRLGFEQRFDDDTVALLHTTDLALIAWYGPIKRLAKLPTDPPDDRTPPLTMLTEGAIPEATPRGGTFLPSFPSILDLETNAALLNAISNMPVPMVRLPRLYAWDLPVIGVIAHEVGHLVGNEFGLLATVAQAMETLAVPDSRRSDWIRWQEEVWCDVYGAHCLGPAYTIGLAHFLDGNDSIDTSYPSGALRLGLQRALLERLGSWDPVLDTVCPKTADEHLADVGVVADLLLPLKFPSIQNRALAGTNVRPFDAQLLAQASDKGLWKALQQPNPLSTSALNTPVDVLLAAGPLLAAHQPQAWPDSKILQQHLTEWSNRRGREVRSRPDKLAAKVASDRASSVLGALFHGN